MQEAERRRRMRLQWPPLHSLSRARAHARPRRGSAGTASPRRDALRARRAALPRDQPDALADRRPPPLRAAPARSCAALQRTATALARAGARPRAAEHARAPRRATSGSSAPASTRTWSRPARQLSARGARRGDDSAAPLSARVRPPPMAGRRAAPARAAARRARGAFDRVLERLVAELRRRLGSTLHGAGAGRPLRRLAAPGRCRSRCGSRPTSRSPGSSGSPTRPSTATCATHPTGRSAGDRRAPRRRGAHSLRRMTIWSSSIVTVTGRWPAQCSA